MYDLLSGIRVLEVSFLAPDSLGGHLADLGAEVIKVEEPPDGSRIRQAWSPVWVSLHWRWNRGKKSVFLDLKTEEGRDAFRQLAREADVVIDGLRAGAMGRLGLGYEDIQAVNPGIVYCSLSGLGQDGPYRDMPTHGWAFDAFAGLARPEIAEDGSPLLPKERASLVGIQAGPLYAAMGVLAALLRCRATGEGAYIDVAQVDAAVVWRSNVLDSMANGIKAADTEARLRYQFYATGDDAYILFMALEDKFWRNFCDAIGRSELFDHPGARPTTATPEQIEELREELMNIFRSRTRKEWVDIFVAHDIAGSPVYLGVDVLDDEHVTAHNLAIEQPQPDGSTLRLMGTPIRIRGETFEPPAAPAAGEHTEAVLSAAGISVPAVGEAAAK